MTWSKREAVTNLVILGDSPDHKKKVGGLLIDTPFDRMYPDKMNYVIVQKDGEEIVLSGSASLGRQLSRDDIGKFVQCEFTGWGRSANGKFKVIDVNVWDGELTPAMKAWPRLNEVKAPAQKRAVKESDEQRPISDDEFEDVRQTLQDEDDDLGF